MEKFPIIHSGNPFTPEEEAYLDNVTKKAIQIDIHMQELNEQRKKAKEELDAIKKLIQEFMMARRIPTILANSYDFHLLKPEREAKPNKDDYEQVLKEVMSGNEGMQKAVHEKATLYAKMRATKRQEKSEKDPIQLVMTGAKIPDLPITDKPKNSESRSAESRRASKKREDSPKKKHHRSPPKEPKETTRAESPPEKHRESRVEWPPKTASRSEVEKPHAEPQHARPATHSVPPRRRHGKSRVPDNTFEWLANSLLVNREPNRKPPPPVLEEIVRRKTAPARQEDRPRRVATDERYVQRRHGETEERRRNADERTTVAVPPRDEEVLALAMERKVKLLNVLNQMEQDGVIMERHFQPSDAEDDILFFVQKKKLEQESNRSMRSWIKNVRGVLSLISLLCSRYPNPLTPLMRTLVADFDQDIEDFKPIFRELSEKYSKMFGKKIPVEARAVKLFAEKVAWSLLDNLQNQKEEAPKPVTATYVPPAGPPVYVSPPVYVPPGGFIPPTFIPGYPPPQVTQGSIPLGMTGGIMPPSMTGMPIVTADGRKRLPSLSTGQPSKITAITSVLKDMQGTMAMFTPEEIPTDPAEIVKKIPTEMGGTGGTAEEKARVRSLTERSRSNPPTPRMDKKVPKTPPATPKLKDKTAEDLAKQFNLPLPPPVNNNPSFSLMGTPKVVAVH